ncbi:hypothetical protein Emtol_0268 (plasmid) [Emticicia oligotrophica DSM 17448]|uniref:Uncharacterized protein n=1 Tax=Emticicia oligotrophica (strain DSM 17448 / CIP 109782 / MTCC 6937 / GPTSA100-15) TaxID=929562 RepID=A0ABM5N7U8_EMTOG|nr:hypothetical protein Emtol_0268 [Emticicia oligotrophica DSM 17448]
MLFEKQTKLPYYVFAIAIGVNLVNLIGEYLGDFKVSYTHSITFGICIFINLINLAYIYFSCINKQKNIIFLLNIIALIFVIFDIHQILAFQAYVTLFTQIIAIFLILFL